MTPAGDEIALQRIEQALTRLLMRSYRAHTYDRLVRATGVQMDQALVPVLLALRTLGTTRVSDAAEAAGIVPSTMSRHTAQLEALGLLSRHADPDDGRGTLIALTDEGREATQRISAELRETFAEVLGEWSPQDVAAFAERFERFAAGIASGRTSLLARRAA